jgi:hypothetical protein
MVTIRNNNSNNSNNRRPPFRSNNNRRPPFRSNNNRSPPFRSNNEGSKFSNNDNFQRKVPGRNNHNAVKLIEKYNDLAREALANEDKILSENYFQHADHFTRVQNEQESLRVGRVNSSATATIKPVDLEKKVEEVVKTEVETVKKEVTEPEVKKVSKSIDKKVVEKKVAAS